MRILDKTLYLRNYLRLYENFGKLVFTFSYAARFFYGKVFGVDAPGGTFELECFMAEAENITSDIERFDVNSEEISCILVSPKSNCRYCNKKLYIEKKFKLVTVYDNHSGTTTGQRYMKRCVSCKVSENYGYYVKDNIRYIDYDQISENKYLMSTEETVFSMKMMDMYQYELHVTCMPFQSKCMIYNQFFQYVNQKEPQLKATKV